jgi:hypothetical protein
MLTHIHQRAAQSLALVLHNVVALSYAVKAIFGERPGYGGRSE